MYSIHSVGNQIPHYVFKFTLRNKFVDSKWFTNGFRLLQQSAQYLFGCRVLIKHLLLLTYLLMLTLNYTDH